MSSPSSIQKHYQEHFDPESYREKIIDRDGGRFREEELFWFESMKKIFDNPSIRGTTLLDVGSGPTVHNLIPACFHFTEIILSDFVETSRLALEKWLRAEPDALDWTRLLTVAVNVQGYEDVEQGLREVQTLIRKNVKAVIPCDILSEKVVPPEYDHPYDLVMTSLTIEAAAPDYDAFKKCLKKLSALVRYRGHLIMKGFLKGSTWHSGEHEFPYLGLTKEEIHNALLEAGFDDIQWHTMMKRDMEFNYDFQSCYCLSCVKLG